METENKPKVDLVRLITTITIVLVTAGVSGGGAYYYLSTNFQKEREAYINELTVKKTLEKKPVTETKTGNVNNFKPVVAFEPDGSFTDQEKKEIKDKITTPYFDYYNEEELTIVAFVVQKYQTNERPAGGYYYGTTIVDINGWRGGWLFGEKGKIDYWKPECMGECPISDKFRKEHPKNI